MQQSGPGSRCIMTLVSRIRRAGPGYRIGISRSDGSTCGPATTYTNKIRELTCQCLLVTGSASLYTWQKSRTWLSLDTSCSVLKILVCFVLHGRAQSQRRTCILWRQDESYHDPYTETALNRAIDSLHMADPLFLFFAPNAV